MAHSNFIAVVNDLFFTVKIQDAAKRVSLHAEFLHDAEGLLAKAAAQHPALIVFDLNFNAADPIRRILEFKREKALASIPLLAYVSHVQIELKQKAIDAGCDTVLARSAFSRDLPQILARYAGESVNAT